MTSRETVIKVSGLSYYPPHMDHPLFSNVNLAFETGQLSLIKGRTGTGKSTLLLCLSALAPASSGGRTEGSIEYNDKYVSSLPLPIVFQNTESQILSLDIYDELRLSLEDPDTLESDPLVMKYFKLTRFTPTSLSPFQLSDGQKQKLIIIGLLLRKTNVLLLDDPISMQDHPTRYELGCLLRDLKNEGKTVIVASDNMDIYCPYFDAVHVISKGRILSQEPSINTAKSRIASKLMQRQTKACVNRRDNSSQALVECHGVSFTYPNGTKAIENLSLRILPGEIIGIVGQNGSGKSTLALLLNGSLKPSAGQVQVAGLSIESLHPAQICMNIALVFQNPRHSIFMETVVQELQVGAKNVGRFPTNQYVSSIIENYGLAGLEEADPVNLSIGQQKLCCILAALLMKPSVLVLDEPDLGLDEHTLMNLLDATLLPNFGVKSVVLISHNMDLISAVCDRTLILSGGKVLASGSTSSILGNPAILQEANLEQPVSVGERNAEY